MNKENDRNFLYKAKTLDTQKWVTGYIYDNTPLYCFKEDADRLGREIYILTPGFADWGMPRPMEKYQIDPKTVCKYINYLDSNKERIFENDIISFGSINGYNYYQVLIWFNNEIQAMTAVPLDGIEYNGLDYYNNKYNKFNYETFCTMLQDPWGDYSKIEIIGNIFDNSDFLFAKNNFKDIKEKTGEIVESIENGKMKRVFSCCNKDFTELTMYKIPKFCPNCGAKLKNFVKKWEK